MMTVLRVWQLVSRNRDRRTSALPITAFAVTTALILTVLAGALSFFREGGESGFLYQSLASLAVILLVVPLVSLGGSAARLSARRRDDNLSTLRLLGATPRFVAILTIVESTATALVGAIFGVVGYLALTPLVGLIHFRGEAIGPLNLMLNPLVVVGTVLAIALIAAASAALGLRKVALTPLGVKRAAAPAKPGWIRVVTSMIGIGVAFCVVLVASKLTGMLGPLLVLSMVLIAFGTVLGLLNLLGPALLRVMAKVSARRASTAVKLIAAKQVIANPKAAWRQVSGVAMTSFIAVFSGVGLAIVSGASADTNNGADSDSAYLITDIRTGVILLIAISFVMVASTVGVSQAAEVLDRKTVLSGLDQLGMPRPMIESSRTRSIMFPLIAVCLTSSVAAALVMLPLTAVSLILSPLTLATILLSLGAGVVLVWLGIRSTRPVLTSVLKNPHRSAL